MERRKDVAKVAFGENAKSRVELANFRPITRIHRDSLSMHVMLIEI